MADRQPQAARTSDDISAVIIGGGPAEITRLRKLLGTVPGVELTGDAPTLAEAASLIRDRAPDVAFLDADAADFEGPSLLGTDDVSISVVVVANDAELAADAFGRGAVDFLLRPLTRAGLGIAVHRLNALLDRRPDRQRPRQPSRRRPDAEPLGAADAATSATGREGSLSIDDRVAVSLERGRSVDLVPVSEIVWIESLQNYTRLQLVDRKPVVIKRTLSDWEAMLPPEHFGRISRSLMIQLTRLRSSLWQSRDETLLAFDGTDARLSIGRSAAARLKELFRGPGTA